MRTYLFVHLIPICLKGVRLFEVKCYTDVGYFIQIAYFAKKSSQNVGSLLPDKAFYNYARRKWSARLYFIRLTIFLQS